jgi:hypothetical protein
MLVWSAISSMGEFVDVVDLGAEFVDGLGDALGVRTRRLDLLAERVGHPFALRRQRRRPVAPVVDIFGGSGDLFDRRADIADLAADVVHVVSLLIREQLDLLHAAVDLADPFDDTGETGSALAGTVGLVRPTIVSDSSRLYSLFRVHRRDPADVSSHAPPGRSRIDSRVGGLIRRSGYQPLYGRENIGQFVLIDAGRPAVRNERFDIRCRIREYLLDVSQSDRNSRRFSSGLRQLCVLGHCVVNRRFELGRIQRDRCLPPRSRYGVVSGRRVDCRAVFVGHTGFVVHFPDRVIIAPAVIQLRCMTGER